MSSEGNVLGVEVHFFLHGTRRDPNSARNNLDQTKKRAYIYDYCRPFVCHTFVIPTPTTKTFLSGPIILLCKSGAPVQSRSCLPLGLSEDHCEIYTRTTYRGTGKKLHRYIPARLHSLQEFHNHTNFCYLIESRLRSLFTVIGT